MELVQIFQKFSSEETGYAYLERVVWSGGRGTDKQAVFVAVERDGNVRSDLIDSHGVADIKPLDGCYRSSI